MPIADLDAIPQVPLDFVNADHREEARLLNDLGEAIAGLRAGRGGPQEVNARFEALFEHTRQHFGREEEAMRRVGFPPYEIHLGEHERVLEEMAGEGRTFGETGDAGRLWRYAAEAVPAWFVQHIVTMDLMTSRFVAARGG
jgi:hemerythrin